MPTMRIKYLSIYLNSKYVFSLYINYNPILSERYK